MMTVKEVLVEAKSLIEKKENWTQAAFARNAFGHACSELSADAQCFCSLGAINRTVFKAYKTKKLGNMPRSGITGEAIAALNHQTEGSVFRYNDTHSHEEVMQMFDKAIEECEE